MSFNKDITKAYFRYFRFWFLAVGVVLIATIALAIMHSGDEEVTPRGNTTAPTERVYDEADILTPEQEESLRLLIAKHEALCEADFVIRTLNQPVEGDEAKQLYGYRSVYWETNMRDLADDFWDINGYGYNQSFEGDGTILIDNRYPGQRGEWLSTSGRAYEELGSYEIDIILDAVDIYYDDNPYQAYCEYIETVSSYLSREPMMQSGMYRFAVVLISGVIALVYLAYHVGKNRTKDTTPANAYVTGGRPNVKESTDIFLRKHVTRRKIQTSSGGGGHRSGGGARHGGGGRRH